MLTKSEDLFSGNGPEIGILGQFFDDQQDPRLHVGLYWIYGAYKEFIHFLAADHIRIHTPVEAAALRYYGIPISGFNLRELPSLIAFSRRVMSNNFGNLELNIGSIIYRGNRFNIQTGRYIRELDFENQINCSVFVIALLETYGFNLLDWESWPTVNEENRNEYLRNWLLNQNIPEHLHKAFYNFNKEIRGKHVIASPFVENLPGQHTEVEVKATELIAFLRTEFSS